MSYSEEPVELVHQKKTHLYDSAEPLFVRFGFRKTTIEDICKAAGMSKRTFYEHFRDKSDFFGNLIIQIADEMVEEYRMSVTEGMSAREMLDLYLDTYFRCSNEHPVFRVIFDDPSILSAIGSLSKQVQFSSIISALAEIVEYGKSTGEFRDVDPQAATWIIHTMLDSLYLLVSEIYPSDSGLNNSILINEARSFILHGLGGKDE